MEKITSRGKKYFLKHFKQLNIVFSIIFVLLGIALILQMRGIFFVYISPTKYHMVLFPGIELLFFGNILFYFLNSDRGQAAKIKSVLVFLLFTTVYYQPFYWFYMHEDRVVYLNAWLKFLMQAGNYGLLTVTAFLLFRWRCYTLTLSREIGQKLGGYWRKLHTWLDSERAGDEKESQDLAPAKWAQIGAAVFQILLFWLMMVANNSLFTDYMDNEIDTLPFAYQFVNPGWLANDWYLNLDVGYRQPFNLLFGSSVALFGFEYTALLGRLTVYLLFAIALSVFFKAFRIRTTLGIITLYLFLDHQSLVAEEWIIKGVDTKTIAYAFAILACAAFFKKKYFLGFLFAGGALSFHILVGVYSVFCLAIAILLNFRVLQWQWGKFFKQLWIFFVSGALGVTAIFDQLLSKATAMADAGWRIYVNFALGIHLTPTWKGSDWQWALALAACLFAAVYLFWRSRANRFIAAYALASVCLFVSGLLIYQFGNAALMRFYWFRYPDVIVPLSSIILILSILARYAKQEGLGLGRALQVLFLLSAMLILVRSSAQLVNKIQNANITADWEYTDDQEMFAWIAENTPQDAVFWVDPTMARFYVDAQRAMFVSLKHTPQSASDLVEWYQRIELSNGNQPITKAGYRPDKVFTPNFYTLDEFFIQEVAQAYGLNYYLGAHREDLSSLVPVYSTQDLTLYQIDVHE